MSARNDGGPAFPGETPTLGRDGFATHVSGMTLRDWFAGQVLAACCASPLFDWPSSRAAEVCYAQADAMLAARDATGDGK